jgi:hypothetical protein
VICCVEGGHQEPRVLGGEQVRDWRVESHTKGTVSVSISVWGCGRVV